MYKLGFLLEGKIMKKHQNGHFASKAVHNPGLYLWVYFWYMTVLRFSNAKLVFLRIEVNISSFPKSPYSLNSEFIWGCKYNDESEHLQIKFQIEHLLVFWRYLELQMSKWDDSKCSGKIRQLSTTFMKTSKAESIVFVVKKQKNSSTNPELMSRPGFACSRSGCAWFSNSNG